MKKLVKFILTVLLFLICTNASDAQVSSAKSVVEANGSSTIPSNNKKAILRTANDLKSGNWQDVLTSFLQLSVSDITGANKSLNFKSTIFALKVKTDSNLWIDQNYVKQKFARNFQFDLSLKLDTSYKFNGFKTGFTWAVVNKRDSTVFSLVNTSIDKLREQYADDINNAFIQFKESITVKDEIKGDSLKLFNTVNEKVQKALNENYFVPSDSFPKEFRVFLHEALKNGYDIKVKNLDSLFTNELDKLRRQPLLTLSANSTFQNQQKAFNNAGVQLVYLQGIKSKNTNTELDIRLSGNVRDTVVTKKENRADMVASAGINFSLFKTKNQQSFFEFKPYFELIQILTSPYLNEKKSVFSANADIRLRITDNLWLPLTIKYDLEKNNFLGFLNVAFNFNAFK